MCEERDPFAEFRAYIERSEERIKALESQVAVLTENLEHEREIRKSLEKKLADVDLMKQAVAEVNTTIDDFKKQIEYSAMLGIKEFSVISDTTGCSNSTSKSRSLASVAWFSA